MLLHSDHCIHGTANGTLGGREGEICGSVTVPPLDLGASGVQPVKPATLP